MATALDSLWPYHHTSFVSYFYHLILVEFQIPQLWSTCLPSDTDNQVLQQRFAMIQRSEADKQAQAARKAKDKQALAEAKKCGKDAFEAEKAHIASQKLADEDAKKNEKLRLTAIKQTEKA